MASIRVWKSVIAEAMSRTPGTWTPFAIVHLSDRTISVMPYRPLTDAERDDWTWREIITYELPGEAWSSRKRMREEIAYRATMDLGLIPYWRPSA